MDRVAVIGAGETGGLLAHVLARRAVAHDISVIDERGRVAEGKALDIMQAAPVEGFAAAVSGSTDVSHVGGASIVVIADPFGAAPWEGDAALGVLARVRDFAPKALVVCAGAHHRELIERGVRELHVERSRLVGSAPEALVAGVRAAVGTELRRAPRDVAATVLGVPPAHVVIPWEDVTIGGLALSRLATEPARKRIEAATAAMWPPGPYALAAAAAKVVDALLGRSDGVVSCFVAPDDSAGRRARAAAMPVMLDRRGVRDVIVPELNGRDRVRLDTATLL